MKNKLTNLGLSLLSILMLFASCSSDDDMPQNNAAIIQQIEGQVKSGNWRISSYIDSGKNETSDYAGYTFTFNEDGTLLASNGSSTINGRWSITDDSNNSNDDSNDDDDIDFNISFASPPVFSELSDDWDIVSSSSSKIDLIDISGGNGGTDTLVFEKN